MKKSFNILLGAFALVLMASCAKEEALLNQKGESGVARTFTCSFDQTKTDIVEGKTVWVKGDSIWVSNGRAVEHFGVSEADAGKNTFSFTSKLGGAIYVVYPMKAAEGKGLGLVEDKIILNVPSSQDGTFGSANICVARTLDENVVLKNVTAVMKFTIPDDALIPVKAVTLHANGDALTGLCSIDMSTGTPVVESTLTGSDVFIPVEGLNGDYYASVVPGSYKAGFTVTALTTGLQVDSKISDSANEVKINEIVDLGNIGKDLKKLDGDGSAANPWQINSFGDMMAFAYYVNAGNNMAGETVKLNADIEGYALPIGYADPVSGVKKVFKGTFDGNGKTVKLSILGKNAFNENCVGLFGILHDGAVIKNLTVEGTVAAADTVGGVAGLVGIDSTPVVFENVTSKVDVSGGHYVGGVTGYVGGKSGQITMTGIKAQGKITDEGNCAGGVSGCVYSVSGKKSVFTDIDVNSTVSGNLYVGGVIGDTEYVDISEAKVAGSITALDNVGGVAGWGLYVTISEAENKANVTSTLDKARTAFILHSASAAGPSGSSAADGGVGGIVGFGQNCDVQFSSNTGKVSGYVKVGGIVGEAYWTPVNACKNKGAIIATGEYNSNTGSQNGFAWGSSIGGITGYIYASGSITNCENEGTISGRAGAGGIVGNISCTKNTASVPTIKNCINRGTVASTKQTSGGTQYLHSPGTGGICGGASTYAKSDWKTGSTYNSARPSFYNCVNYGNVSSSDAVGDKIALHVGGIIGRFFSYSNSSIGGDVPIEGCVNHGNVTGGCFVGGVVGLVSGMYFMNITAKNCANTGKIVAESYSTKNNNVGTFAGGLFGSVHTWNTNYKTKTNLSIWNCYNTGDVVYTSSSSAKPNVGGILGEGWCNVSVINTYNSGYVGKGETTTAVDGAGSYVGAIVGWQNNSGTTFSYHDGTITPVNGGAATASIAVYDENGNLDKTVEPRSTPATTLLDALNTWANTTAYYKWIAGTKGPKFADPVGSGIDAGNQNLDLGNGGNI